MTGAAGGPEAVVVGAGLMGRWHAHAVRRAGHRVAAVVDRDPARARALAARFPGARACTELVEALAPGRVVHVCTPPESHAAIAVRALHSGCHALVEKPLATTAGETSSLLETARARGLLLVPVHQCVFQPGAERARRAVEGAGPGSVGPVLHVDATACTAGADGRPGEWRDRLTLEVLPHPLSLLARLLTPAVDEVAWQVAHPMAGELRVSGTMGAASVSMLVSTRGRPTRHEMRLVCARGTVRLDLFHGYAVIARGAPGRARKLALPFLEGALGLGAATANLAARAARREPAYPGLRTLVARLYAAARDGGEAPLGAGETLAVARAVDAIAARLSPPAAGTSPAYAAGARSAAPAAHAP